MKFLESFAQFENENGDVFSFSMLILILIPAIIILSVIIFAIVKIVEHKKRKRFINNFKDSALELLFRLNISDEEKKLLCEMVTPCVELGDKIDRHTNRKNNFVKVSNLVFDLAKNMNKNDRDCFLYFLSAMVYDAGFLEMDKSLFRMEVLSVEERLSLRKHVLRGTDFIDFVTSNYVLVFISAIFLHHENINGSGYPEGLLNEEIPDLPRIIRVAESYVSLTSRRSYHKIRNPKEAVAELKNQKSIYDMNIVNLLEKYIMLDI